MTETTTSSFDQKHNQIHLAVEHQDDVIYHDKIVLALLDSELQSPSDESVDRILLCSKQLK